MKKSVIRLAFRVYKSLVSPVIHALSPSRCLYLPTCSEYAYVAVVRFGLLHGSWLALRRLLRCHPWGKGGLDPVPEDLPGHRAPSKSCCCNHSPTDQTAQTPADHLP